MLGYTLSGRNHKMIIGRVNREGGREMEANKAGVVERLQEAKRKSGKTYRQLANETGLSNAYVAQLLRRQAQLKPLTAPKLREVLPDLSEELLGEMMKPPWRSYDPSLIQEPAVYRFHEAVMHYAESVKEIINEEYGDGIMSAIDFNCSVDKARGAHGEERVVVTFDGKFLPFNEQRTEEMATKVVMNGTLK